MPFVTSQRAQHLSNLWLSLDFCILPSVKESQNLQIWWEFKRECAKAHLPVFFAWFHYKGDPSIHHLLHSFCPVSAVSGKLTKK